MRKHLSLFALGVALAVAPQVNAIEDVLSVTTVDTATSSVTADGYIFEGRSSQITEFSTATNSYGVSSVADNVYVRRNTVNANQSSVWYVSSGVGSNLAGVHESSYGSMLLGNNLLSGSDNTFTNNTGAPATVGNIERLDLVWNSALTVTDAFAFAVFERGDVAVHDSFAIAAILSVDGSGTPTAFGSLLKIAGGWGATNAVASADYRLFRYSNGNDIGTSTANTETGRQGVGGLLISAADLGLIAGTQIYGYALMAADVSATDSTQLLDWTNGTYYPTTTDGATGGGGIDLASLNGVAFAVVPETGALLPLLAFGVAFGCAHFRRTRRARAA